jgi:hypothetical protein
MQRQDVPHFTPEQVVTVLEEALAVLDVVKPPAQLEVATFEAAARMLSGKEIVLVQPQPIDLSQLRGNGLL